jgi:hypothetical protein
MVLIGGNGERSRGAGAWGLFGLTLDMLDHGGDVFFPETLVGRGLKYLRGCSSGVNGDVHLAREVTDESRILQHVLQVKKRRVVVLDGGRRVADEQARAIIDFLQHTRNGRKLHSRSASQRQSLRQREELRRHDVVADQFHRCAGTGASHVVDALRDGLEDGFGPFSRLARSAPDDVQLAVPRFVLAPKDRTVDVGQAPFLRLVRQLVDERRVGGSEIENQRPGRRMREKPFLPNRYPSGRPAR